ncbi:MAG TPA: 2,3-bisphosphoglycerate-independent phosphoglycerate mutase [Anaerolineales bacterium]|nr:2,3-bisphosphoglycerate-independent phosphoglycerate mutase [Anaerolineales bacterium]
MLSDFDLMRELAKSNDRRIVLLVLDGLGGLPVAPGGPTELEAARKPEMDRLASEGALGLTIPVRRGISPGSGPAHLALFGYDPLEHIVGRGVLEAVGVGVQVAAGDIAARGNFCTLDSQGLIRDRRAGRIPSDKAAPLVERLGRVKVAGATFEARHVKEHRFALVARGQGLEADLDDTDPQATGVAPLPVRPRRPEAQATAELFNRWIAAATAELAKEREANGLTLRGFSSDPRLPSMSSVFRVRPACVAVYPMYRGVSRLVGMEVLEVAGESPEDEFSAVRSAWETHDFFFIHIKKPDSRGEDGDFEAKVQAIEAVDRALPALLDLQPDVLAITGDHSTPARLKSHSWHPVPFLLWAPATIRPDAARTFGERACASGGLGTFPAKEILPQLLAHAGRLEKFGA